MAPYFVGDFGGTYQFTRRIQFYGCVILGNLPPTFVEFG